ncbi:MAG TPA: phosphatase PAP2 family protein [Kofleriaceae bacterium]|nr:phosphatase PAP2 family protein [Kofleriaceae bacterium]
MKTRSLPKRALVGFGIAMVAALVFVLLMKEVLEGNADAFDRRWALAIHDRLATPILTWFLIGVTYVGSGWGVVAVIAVMTLALYRQHHWRTGLILLCDALAAEVLMRILKAYVERPRPTLFDEITRPETWSFPSGHALTAMAVYGGIGAVFITLYPARRLPIIIATAVWVFLIGFSRVYLGVHWPTDIVAGWAAGVPLLIVTVRLLHRKERLKIGRPLPG